jgi:hypothetical protein
MGTDNGPDEVRELYQPALHDLCSQRGRHATFTFVVISYLLFFGGHLFWGEEKGELATSEEILVPRSQ